MYMYMYIMLYIRTHAVLASHSVQVYDTAYVHSSDYSELMGKDSVHKISTSAVQC